MARPLVTPAVRDLYVKLSSADDWLKIATRAFFTSQAQDWPHRQGISFHNRHGSSLNIYGQQRGSVSQVGSLP